MLKHEFGYSLTELENLLPFERDLYIDLTIADIENKRQLEKDALKSG